MTPSESVPRSASERGPDPAGDSEEMLLDLVEQARRVHDSLELTETLTTIARGVTAAIGFSTASVNMVQADGSWRTVAVEGGDEVRAALLHQTATAEQWRNLMDQATAWGDLRYIRISGESKRFPPSWRTGEPPSDEPDRWHPDDALFVPLKTRSDRLLGALSVDMPMNGLLPDDRQRQVLSLFGHHAALAIEHALIYEELRLRHDEVRWAATHDQLTGLSNRSVLADVVPRLAEAPGTRLAAVVIDLDGFKEMNDTGGHLIGDRILIALSQRMRACVRQGDLLARTGGDEFVVVFSSDDADAAAAALVERLSTSIGRPVQIDDRSYVVTASVGRAVADTPVDFDRLLGAADADMYRVKNARR